MAPTFNASVAPGPPPDEVEDLEQQYLFAERWPDLVGLFIERALAAVDSWERTRNLVRAALICETKMGDPGKAFMTLQAAFAEDFSRADVAQELERLTTSLGNWRVLMQDCDSRLGEATDPVARVHLMIWMARWQVRYLADDRAAEALLDAALALDPSSTAGARALADLYGRRGEWARAALLLVQAAGGSEQPPEKARLFVEAADIHRSRLADTGQAIELYARVLQLEPQQRRAAEALVDLAFERQDFARAVPVLEHLLADGRSQVEHFRLHRLFATAAARTGQGEKARASLRRAHELEPTDVSNLSDWLALAFEQGWWQDVRDVAGALLALPTAQGFAGTRRLDCLVRLGQAQLALGDSADAVAVLTRVVQDAPEHRTGREALIDAHVRLEDPASALQQQRLLLGTLKDPDARFALLRRMAETCRDGTKQPDEALAAYAQALDLRPDDRQTLHDSLDLLTVTRQWKRAVAVLQKLAAPETGETRAKYLLAAANICHYELHASDEAVELYNQVLDGNPDDLKPFEKIDKILTGRRAWKDEARSYRRMIKRLGPTPAPDKKGTLLALWKGLGEIYRSRLEDLDAASAAFEVCASLDAADPMYQEILAEIFERQGPAGVPRARATRTLLCERAATPDDLARQLRALRRLYFDQQDYDRVWCVCAALVALRQAEDKEVAFYQQYAPPGLVLPRATLTEDLWQRCVYHRLQDRRLSQIFALLSPAVAIVRAKEVRAWGLRERNKIDPEADSSLVARVLDHASRLLGVGRPALYLHPDVPGEVDLANVVGQQQLMPSFVVGADLMKRGEKEAAFILGKNLALLRLDHLVLWPHVVPSTAELKVILLAGIRRVHPGADAPADVDRRALQQYQTLFEKTVGPQAVEQLAAVIPQLLADGRATDLHLWARMAARTANRAGLLVCGDVAVASRLLQSDEDIQDLVRWSVSDEFLTLRAQLGLGVDAQTAQPFRRPTALGQS